MGEVPTTVNKTLGAAEEIINGGVMSVMAPITIQLISSVPQLSFLKIWPLSWFLSLIVNKVFSYLNVALQVAGVKLIISIQTDEERSIYQKAESELRKALLSGDKDAIEKARLGSNHAIDNLIHYDGSSPIIT